MTMQQELKKVQNKFLSKNYPGALDQCNELLEVYKTDSERAVLLRSRHGLYDCLQQIDDAYTDVEEIINNRSPEVEDYFCAASYLLQKSMYKQAIPLLNQGIILSCDRDETYYFRELNFLKGFALAQFGEIEKVEETLSFVNKDIKMWIDKAAQPYTYDEVLDIAKSNCHNN